MQNGNNRYTVIVNGDCTVTVSFISTGEFEKAVEEMRQELRGEHTNGIEVKASIISGQGVFGDPLVAENEHKNWANALSTALHAGTDENTIASVNDTNYAMIVLHGAYIGISGSETNSTQRLL